MVDFKCYGDDFTKEIVTTFCLNWGLVGYV